MGVLPRFRSERVVPPSARLDINILRWCKDLNYTITVTTHQWMAHFIVSWLSSQTISNDHHL